MSFLIGGGNSDTTYVALAGEDGKELMRACGTNGPMMRRVNWGVGQLMGRTAFLRVVDQRERQWAHVTFDDFSADGELVEPLPR